VRFTFLTFLSILLNKMNIPLPLRNLFDARIGVYETIVENFPNLFDDEQPQLPVERLRVELNDEFNEMEDVCYLRYMGQGNNIRIPHQDAWLHRKNTILELSEQFDDRAALLEALNCWLQAHDCYRQWLMVCNIHPERINEIWEFMEDEDDEE